MSEDAGRIRAAYEKLKEDAESGGYHLNPDEEWTLGLVKGLLTNQERYGYQACPCRLASGKKEDDLDIICPCDYRDPDLQDYGACYCAMYVSDEVLTSARVLTLVPERRPAVRPRREPPTQLHEGATSAPSTATIRLWRCRVCGYLCAREHPPLVCPVCKAKQERFEAFVLPPSAIPIG
ncbi:MAG: ferredoxin:glutaredoxin reductase [Chloroflexi bacterium]|nr:ferredoxin:glutaredoxin reductase [Chloroflexota bacterium]MCL5025342.1 ferredoxin:glutaredoxin reductase [Chloroflexota bacterium]